MADSFATAPRDTPVVAGVYFLFREGELTYVGRSNDCYGRIASHRQKGRDFDLATVMPLAMEFIPQVEKALIAGFTPPQNRMRPPPQIVMPAPAAPPPPDPYGDLPSWAPRPTALGLISPTAARDLAMALSLTGSVVKDAEEAGELHFFETGKRSHKGPVRAARYDDTLSVLRARRQEKLRSLGFAPSACGRA